MNTKPSSDRSTIADRLIGQTGFLEMVCHYWAKYPWRSLIVVVGMIVSGTFEGIGLAAVLPLLALLIDNEGGGDSELYTTFERTFEVLGLPFALEFVLAAIVVALLLKSLTKAGIGIYLDYSMQLIGRDNRAELIDSLSAARWPYFTKQPSGVLANLAGFEADRAAGSFGSVHKFTDAGLRLVIFVGVGLALSPSAMFLGVTLGIASLAVLRPLIAMARSAGAAEAVTLRNLISDLTQTLFIFKSLKAMGSERRVLNMIGALNQELSHARRQAIIGKKLLELSQELIILVVIAAGLYVGFRVIGVPAGEMMFAALLLVRIHNQVGELQKRYQSIANTQPVFTQLRTTLHQIKQEKEIWRGKVQLAGVDKTIVVEKVRFSHGANLVLAGVSLTVPAKQITLITGPSGAGKTTIVDLVCGFYAPDQGRILVNGEELGALDIRAWRQTIGYLPQTPTLLNRSIAENVTYFDPGISSQAVAEALRLAGAWEFVETLPNGIDTPVGERGARFSGGQQQRIALARALVRKPALLVLDEPTASVDTETERLICEQLVKIKREMTVLAISHSRDLVRVADVVYRLEAGRIGAKVAPLKEISAVR